METIIGNDVHDVILKQAKELITGEVIMVIRQHVPQEEQRNINAVHVVKRLL